jgi:hypothetical protein
LLSEKEIINIENEEEKEREELDIERKNSERLFYSYLD